MSHEPLAFAAGRLSGLDSLSVPTRAPPAHVAARRPRARWRGRGCGNRPCPGRDSKVEPGRGGWRDEAMCPKDAEGATARADEPEAGGIPLTLCTRHACAAFVPHSRDPAQGGGGFLGHSGSHRYSMAVSSAHIRQCSPMYQWHKGGQRYASLPPCSLGAVCVRHWATRNLGKWPRAGRFQVAQNVVHDPASLSLMVVQHLH